MSPRRINFLVLVCCALLGPILAQDAEKYPAKYDHIDVDMILANTKLRTQYTNCYLEKGPCLTPDARFLKEKFPEVIVTRCSKCTEKQKVFFDKVTTWFTENDPDTWNVLVKKAIDDAQGNRRN